MNKNLRKTVIAGNWKMNNTITQTKSLIKELIPLVKTDNCDVVICVPFTSLETAINLTNGTNIKVASQNCHFEKNGAYTGEISADMLKEIGVSYVVIGHSERRQYFGETDVTVNKRTKACIESDMTAIVCVGELLHEREQGITNEIITLQTKIAVMGLTKDDMKKVIIAYEPVWAIGTGKTATSEQANDVCKLIRTTIEKIYDKNVADSLTIQYGGSMNPNNAKELLSKPDVDGGLIGGASLKASDFSAIISSVD